MSPYSSVYFVATPPLDSPCDRPVTYPRDSKHYS